MRFLFISSNPNGSGGSEHLWAQTALHLKSLGHHVEALTSWASNGSPQGYALQLRSSKIPLHALQSSWIHRIYPRLNGYRFREANTQRVLRKGRFDLVVLSNGSWSDAPEILRALLKQLSRFVTLDHGINPNSWPSKSLIETLSVAYPKSVSNFFVAEACAELAALQLGVDLPNAKVVRNPFQVPYSPVTPWPMETPEKSFRLACVGRIELRQKAQELLLQVLDLPKWRQRPLTLSLYGDGPHAESLQRQIQRMKLTAIQMRGRSSDIEDVWRSHHALVLPSRFENLPIAIVEAMLCARPCIVTDVGGNRELIEPGKEGFVAESACVAAIDRALEEAWNRRHEWQEMGNAAREKILALMPEHPEHDFAHELEALAHGR